MYPLGHLGTGLIIASVFSMPVAAFIVGVFLPDIVDKGLSMLGLMECSRYAAHTVVFASGAGAVAFAATRKKEIALAIFFGCLLHLVQDSAHFVPYLYPFVDYPDRDCHPVAFAPGDFEIAMEIVGAALIVVWWKWRAKLFYLRERILKSGGSSDRGAKKKLRVEKVGNKAEAR